jgi:hypothetical protein
MHLAAIAPAQRHQYGAGCATGADDQRIIGSVGPGGGIGIEIAEKAQIVGIGAVHLAVAHHQSIDRPDHARQPVDAVAERKDGFLVGDGDIAAGKFARTQALEEGRQAGRRHVDGFVAAIDIVLGQPGAVDERRARMGNGMPDDEGLGGQGFNPGIGVARERYRAMRRAREAAAAQGW